MGCAALTGRCIANCVCHASSQHCHWLARWGLPVGGAMSNQACWRLCCHTACYKLFWLGSPLVVLILMPRACCWGSHNFAATPLLACWLSCGDDRLSDNCVVAGETLSTWECEGIPCAVAGLTLPVPMLLAFGDSWVCAPLAAGCVVLWRKYLLLTALCWVLDIRSGVAHPGRRCVMCQRVTCLCWQYPDCACSAGVNNCSGPQSFPLLFGATRPGATLMRGRECWLVWRELSVHVRKLQGCQSSSACTPAV